MQKWLTGFVQLLSYVAISAHHHLTLNFSRLF